MIKNGCPYTLDIDIYIHLPTKLKIEVPFLVYVHGRHAFATMSFIAETFIFLYVGMDALDIEKWRLVKSRYLRVQQLQLIGNAFSDTSMPKEMLSIFAMVSCTLLSGECKFLFNGVLLSP